MALQIADKSREEKSKGEKERYAHLNAEFQGIERRDKTAFLNEQCKKTEENNKMEKTRECPAHASTCLFQAGQESLPVTGQNTFQPGHARS